MPHRAARAPNDGPHAMRFAAFLRCGDAGGVLASTSNVHSDAIPRERADGQRSTWPAAASAPRHGAGAFRGFSGAVVRLPEFFQDRAIGAVIPGAGADQRVQRVRHLTHVRHAPFQFDDVLLRQALDVRAAARSVVPQAEQVGDFGYREPVTQEAYSACSASSIRPGWASRSRPGWAPARTCRYPATRSSRRSAPTRSATSPASCSAEAGARTN